MPFGLSAAFISLLRCTPNRLLQFHNNQWDKGQRCDNQPLLGYQGNRLENLGQGRNDDDAQLQNNTHDCRQNQLFVAENPRSKNGL